MSDSECSDPGAAIDGTTNDLLELVKTPESSPQKVWHARGSPAQDQGGMQESSLFLARQSRRNPSLKHDTKITVAEGRTVKRRNTIGDATMPRGSSVWENITTPNLRPDAASKMTTSTRKELDALMASPSPSIPPISKDLFEMKSSPPYTSAIHQPESEWKLPDGPSEELIKVFLKPEMLEEKELTFYKHKRKSATTQKHWPKHGGREYLRVETVSPGLLEQGLRTDMWIIMIGTRHVALSPAERQKNILGSMMDGLKKIKEKGGVKADKAERGIPATFCAADPMRWWIPNTPRALGVWVQIRGITNIDTLHQSFDSRLFFRFVWQPSRQELEEYRDTRVDENGIQHGRKWKQKWWRPAFDFPNAQSFETRKLLKFKGPTKMENYILVENGNVNTKGFKDPMAVDAMFYGEMEVNGTFSEQLELKVFPFDVQDLQISIWSYFAKSIMQFVPYDHFLLDNQYTKKPFEMVTLLTSFSSATNEWDIYDPIVDVDHQALPTIHIRNKVKRKPSVYILRMMLPIALITGGSLISFLIHLDDGAERLAYGFTAVLTAVVFQLAIYADLPDIPYMTNIDWYILGCFVFMLLVVAQTGVMTFLNGRATDDIDPRGDPSKVGDIDNYCGFAFCGVFFVAHLYFYLVVVKHQTGIEMSKLNMNGQQLKDSFDIESKAPPKRVSKLYTSKNTSVVPFHDFTDSYTTIPKEKLIQSDPNIAQSTWGPCAPVVVEDAKGPREVEVEIENASHTL